MTNVEHLKSILSKYELENTEEALEFLEAIENEVGDLSDQLKVKQEECDDLTSHLSSFEDDFDNSDFVGLDTIRWKLDKGNLAIQQKMEYFIQQLKKQNAVVPV